jgi:hypothetical protein
VDVGRSARQIGFSFVGFPSSSPVMQYPSLSPSAKICTNCGALQWPIHCNLQLSVRFAIAHRDCMTGPEGLPAPACTRNAEWKLMLFAAPRVGQSSNGSSGGPLGTRKPRSFLPCLMQLPLVESTLAHREWSRRWSYLRSSLAQHSVARKELGTARLHSRPSTRRPTPGTWNISAWKVHGNKLAVQVH